MRRRPGSPPVTVETLTVGLTKLNTKLSALGDAVMLLAVVTAGVAPVQAMTSALGATITGRLTAGTAPLHVIASADGKAWGGRLTVGVPKLRAKEAAPGDTNRGAATAGVAPVHVIASAAGLA